MLDNGASNLIPSGYDKDTSLKKDIISEMRSEGLLSRTPFKQA